MSDDLIKEHAKLMNIIKKNEKIIREYIVVTLNEVVNSMGSVNAEMSTDDVLKIIAENKTKIEDIMECLDGN